MRDIPFFWPSVATMEKARSARLYGFWAAVVSATVTALAAAWAIGSGRLAMGFVGAGAFIDAAIFAAVAAGIFRESRVAAVAGLLIFIGQKVFQIQATGQYQAAVAGLLFVLMYITSIRAVFSLRRLRVLQADESPAQ